MSVFVRCGLRVLPSALFVFLITGTHSLSAQGLGGGLDSFRHTYDPEHGYMPIGGAGLPSYGYGGSGMVLPNTPAAGAGVAAAGVGQLDEGKGQMHLSNAQAAGAFESAKTQYLKNKGLANQTLQQDAALQRQADSAFQARMLQQEQAQVALYHRSMEQMAAAHRLTAEQFDMDRGVLHWPFCLRGPDYKDLRTKLDLLYDARTPADSGPNSSGYTGITEACEAMHALVKQEVRKGMPITDYVTADHFISSIEYEAQFSVKAPQASGPQNKVASGDGGSQ